MKQTESISADQEAKEAGWEFTLPGFVANPLNWVLAILILIALILSFVLLSKFTDAQNINQITTKQSP